MASSNREALYVSRPYSIAAVLVFVTLSALPVLVDTAVCKHKMAMEPKVMRRGTEAYQLYFHPASKWRCLLARNKLVSTYGSALYASNVGPHRSQRYKLPWQCWRKRLSIDTVAKLRRVLARGVPARFLDVRGDLQRYNSPLNPMNILKLKSFLKNLRFTNSTKVGTNVELQSLLRSNAKPAERLPYPMMSRESISERTLSGDLLHDEWSPIIESALNSFHPVIEVLHQRKLEASKPGNRSDKYKLGLVIEGGGMRGCIAAGMAVALNYMGYADCFDVVYGSSAGSLIGAFFVSRQVLFEGCQIYYKWLPAAGHHFINFAKMGRSIGLGPFFNGDIKDFIKDSLGKPALDLSVLLNDIVQSRQPLDWEAFWTNNRVQPLKILVSGLVSERSITLDSDNGNFGSREELMECLRASMLLPGISGPVLRLSQNAVNVKQTFGPVFHKSMPRFTPPLMATLGEPMADAMLYEAIPYRSALNENCTHVFVLRTQPDGHPVTRTGGIDAYIEQRMAKRYFQVKHGLRNIYDHIKKKRHRIRYMEDLLTLNEAVNSRKPFPNREGQDAYLYAVALPCNESAISRTERKPKLIYEGVRKGFAEVYRVLVDDPLKANCGYEVAKTIFSDERLKNSKVIWRQEIDTTRHVKDAEAGAPSYNDASNRNTTIEELLNYAQNNLRR